MKENGQRKKPNEKKEQKKTPNRTKRPITIQILQRQRRQSKTKNGKITPAEEKVLKTKFTGKGSALFGSVQNIEQFAAKYHASK